MRARHGLINRRQRGDRYLTDSLSLPSPTSPLIGTFPPPGSITPGLTSKGTADDAGRTGLHSTNQAMCNLKYIACSCWNRRLLYAGSAFQHIHTYVVDTFVDGQPVPRFPVSLLPYCPSGIRQQSPPAVPCSAAVISCIKCVRSTVHTRTYIGRHRSSGTCR